MFDVGWQVWLGLILVGIVVYFVLDAPSNPNSLGQNIVRLWLRLLDRLAVPEGAMPADEARAERTERLKSWYPGLTDDTVAAFLLAEANALTATISDGIRRLEARALAQIGLAGAAVVLLSFFASKSDATVQPAAPFEFALVLLFVAIVVSAIALMPPRCRPPSVEVYNALGTCENTRLKGSDHAGAYRSRLDLQPKVAGRKREEGALARSRHRRRNSRDLFSVAQLPFWRGRPCGSSSRACELPAQRSSLVQEARSVTL